MGKNGNGRAGKAFPDGLLPSITEVWMARGPDVDFEIGDMERGEDGPAWLRSHLPPQFQSIGLVVLRDAFAALNKRGGVVAKHGPHTKAPIHRAEQVTAALLRSFPPVSHTEDYRRYMDSEAWKARASRHKRECGYRCQVCARVRHGMDLQVHHIAYGALDGTESPLDLLCVCEHPCHGMVDGMRRWGRVADESTEIDESTWLGK